jgi:glutamyl-tRNA reductase
MKIAVIGISYRDAGVDVRGRLAFTSSMKEKAVIYLKEKGLDEFMILSTCNRSEIYVASLEAHNAIFLIKAYFSLIGGHDIQDYLYVKEENEALIHIYQVACGLKSLVLGEDQILGQLKDAMQVAIELGTCKKHLSKVVREAVTFSKRIRHQYKFSENQLSVAAIGIKYLKQSYGQLSSKKIMLIGTGSMGQLVLKYLQVEGVNEVFVTNRSCHKGNEIEFQRNQIKHIKQIEYSERYDYIPKMDIIISATSSPHFVVEANKLYPSQERITFLDMAVPRDIDAAIGRIDNYQVYTIDDFNSLAEQHKNKRLDSARKINEEIEKEIHALELWLIRSKVDDVIIYLKESQTRNLHRALEEAKDILMDTEQTQKLEEIMKRAMWEMIKEPITQLKELHTEEEIDQYRLVMEKLYAI